MNKEDSKRGDRRIRTRSANKSSECSNLAVYTKRKYRRKCSTESQNNSEDKDEEVFHNETSISKGTLDGTESQKVSSDEVAQSQPKMSESPDKKESEDVDTSDEEVDEQSSVDQPDVTGDKDQASVSDGNLDAEPENSSPDKLEKEEPDLKKSAADDRREPDADQGTRSLDSDMGSATSSLSDSRSQAKKSKSGFQNALHSRIDFKVGVRVEARDYLNMWYAAKIVQVDMEEKEVLIHFERWSSRFDEWVSMDSPRLRAVARTSARKEKRAKPSSVRQNALTDHKVNEVVMAKWTDCKMYPAKILKVNQNGSYQVHFYDGFEKTVQPINIKRILPGQMEKVEFRCTPSASGGMVEKRRKPYTKRTPVKETTGSEKRRSRVVSPSGKSEGKDKKGTSPGCAQKREKLLVGGIFQAKRHTTRSPPPTPKKRPGAPRLEKSSKQTEEADDTKQSKKIKVAHSQESSKDVSPTQSPVIVIEPVADTAKPVVGPESVGAKGMTPSKRKQGMGVASKEFRIEADHNQHKCPMEGCGKGFRKESNLLSHMKHYHNDLSVAEAEAKKEEEKPKVEKDKMLKEALKSPPLQPGTVDLNVGLMSSPETSHSKDGPEGDFQSRKLVTEKRRQILMQKRLENLRKKRQADASKSAKRNLSQELSKGGTAASKRRHSSGTGKATDSGETKRPKSADGFTESQPKKKKSDADSKTENDSPVAVPAGDVTSGQLTISKSNKRKKESNTADLSISEGNDSAKPVLETQVKKEKPYKVNVLSARELQMKVWNDEEREEVVNCICGLQEEDGLMMQCEICLAWQHGACFHIEEESKVPENYVCYTCANPKGGGKRCRRYMHEQEWIKRGELANFKFVQGNCTSRRQKENIVKTHAIASQVINIHRLLPTLHFKLNIARSPDHPCLKLFANPWNASLLRENHKSKVECKSEPEDMEACSENQHSCAFGDHSYSAPSRASLPVVKLARSGNADFGLTECMRPYQGMLEPLVTRIKQEPEDHPVVGNTTDIDHTSQPEDGLDLDTCRLNLLDHIEQLQDEVDRRLEELGQLLEGMEAEYENTAITETGDSLTEGVWVKRMMRALLTDLGKVRRMSLYC